MKINPLLIPKNVILPISIMGIVLTFLGTLFKLSHWHFGFITPNILLLGSIIFSLLSVSVVLLDIVRNPIKNKLLWGFPLLFIGNLIAMIYLINRDVHIRKALR